MKRLTKKGHLYTYDQVFRYICSLNIAQCLNRLRQYEDLELTPDEIMEIDNLYAEKCREVAELQKEAEYGKWIPVEERLPEVPKKNPEFGGNKLELYLVTSRGCVYPFRAFWNGKDFTAGWMKCDVIAWQPLPEPYRPEEPK